MTLGLRCRRRCRLARRRCPPQALPKTARRRRRRSPPQADHPAVVAVAAWGAVAGDLTAAVALPRCPGGCAADGDELNEEIGEL